GLARSAAAAADRGEYPPHERAAVAVGRDGLRCLVIIRLPAGNTGRTGGGGPRGSAFHGFHHIKGSRARHDAPSTGQFCSRSAPPPGCPGRRQRYAAGPTICDARGGPPSLSCHTRRGSSLYRSGGAGWAGGGGGGRGRRGVSI